MNGKPGDHPLTDLFIHGLPVFSPAVEALLREIRALAGDREWRRLEDSIPWFPPPPDAQLQQRLRAVRDRLRREAQERGWEVK